MEGNAMLLTEESEIVGIALIAYVLDDDMSSAHTEPRHEDLLPFSEQFDQCETIFASAQSDEYMVVVGDEGVVGARFVEEPDELSEEELELLFLRCGCHISILSSE